MNPFVLFALIVLPAAPAHAYIDPGTGGAVGSVVVGLIVALGVWFKSRWYQLKGLFRRGRRDR